MHYSMQLRMQCSIQSAVCTQCSAVHITAAVLQCNSDSTIAIVATIVSCDFFSISSETLQRDTWDNISKANSGHGDETEVETFKEGPVLPKCEERGSKAEEDAEEDKRSKHRVKVVTECHLIIIIVVISRQKGGYWVT